jgi:ribosomal protein S18 acetylase RimI-like enzyme
MPGAILIRRLGAADVADYRDIRLATLLTEPAAFGSVHATEVLRPLADFARVVAGQVVFAAFDDAEIVGVARFARESGPKEAHKGSVHGFFVRQGYRARGIGTGLMTAVLDHARDCVEQVSLAVVQGNTAAIALYQRFGFVTYGIEPRARKDRGVYTDMTLMALLLK